MSETPNTDKVSKLQAKILRLEGMINAAESSKAFSIKQKEVFEKQLESSKKELEEVLKQTPTFKIIRKDDKT